MLCSAFKKFISILWVFALMALWIEKEAQDFNVKKKWLKTKNRKSIPLVNLKK